MKICAFCSRPANTLKTERDEWQRVRQVYICDDHDRPVIQTTHESQREFMERRGFK